LGTGGRYRIGNLNGWPTAQSKDNLSGTIEFLDDRSWRLAIKLKRMERRDFSGAFDAYPIQVTQLGASTCRAVIRSEADPNRQVVFDVLDASAAEVRADLASRSCDYDTLATAAEERRHAAAADARARQQRADAGEWWATILPFGLTGYYRYSGSTDNYSLGSIAASVEGLVWQVQGERVSLAWPAIGGLEISSRDVPRVTIGRTMMFGALGAVFPAHETWTFVHVTSASVQSSFAREAGLTEMVAEWQPVLDAWNAHVARVGDAVAAAATVTAPPGAGFSVADELEKLASLRERGLLTDAEFGAQKAKLLSPHL
jgi:hypothetical protein